MLSGQISGQSTDNTILNWHRRFPYSGHIQGTQGTQGRFFGLPLYYYKIQKLKFTNFEMSVFFVIFHYVMILPIFIKKYLNIINWCRRFPYSGQNVPSGQSQGRFLFSGHISSDTEDFRTQGTFRALRALRAHFLGYPSIFYKYIFLKIYKNWNWCKFYQKLCIVKNHSLTHDVSLCLYFCQVHFQISLNVLYETIFNFTLFHWNISIIRKKIKDLIFIIKKY